jgi:hypothetical protein
MRKIVIAMGCLAFAAGFAWSAPATAQHCVPFQGIDHCPVGNAVLDLAPDGSSLSVSGLGLEGQDGFLSLFAGSTQWSADVEFSNPSNEPSTVTMTAHANGKATSHATVRPVEGGYLLQANFTGDVESSTYSALIYLDGVLQASVGGIRSSGTSTASGKLKAAAPTSGFESTSAAIAVYVDGMYWGELDLDRNWWWWTWGFGIMSNGGCTWGLHMAEPELFSLPDGSTAHGDEIVLIEEVRGGGHYPYVSFDSIQMTSSVEGLKVTGEITQRGE